MQECWVNGVSTRKIESIAKGLGPQRGDKERGAARLRLIWRAPDDKSARDMKSVFCQEYEKLFPKAVECLEEGFEDSVQFYAFEELDSRKISSTNTLERLNREIRRAPLLSAFSPQRILI